MHRVNKPDTIPLLTNVQPPQKNLAMQGSSQKDILILQVGWIEMKNTILGPDR
jgi:hypothetical protein